MATVQFDFTNTTSVITGGCSGIGLCCALAIVEAGGNVIVSSSRDSTKTAAALQLLAEKKKKKKHDKSKQQQNNIQQFIVAYDCNVGDEISVAIFFNNVYNTICSNTDDSIGRLDYVIHCAGVSPNTEFLQQTQKEWDTVHNVNSTGSFLIIKYAAKLMKQQQLKKVISNNFILNNNSNGNVYESRGSILLVSSTNGINSNDSISAHYDSSKASVNMLVRNSSEYLTCNYNIIVNGIAPGWINTELNTTVPTDIRTKETSRIWTNRWSTPEEIAIVVMQILTMPYYIGQTLLVDGGYR